MDVGGARLWMLEGLNCGCWRSQTMDVGGARLWMLEGLNCGDKVTLIGRVVVTLL